MKSSMIGLALNLLSGLTPRWRDRALWRAAGLLAFAAFAVVAASDRGAAQQPPQTIEDICAKNEYNCEKGAWSTACENSWKSYAKGLKKEHVPFFEDKVQVFALDKYGDCLIPLICTVKRHTLEKVGSLVDGKSLKLNGWKLAELVENSTTDSRQSVVTYPQNKKRKRIDVAGLSDVCKNLKEAAANSKDKINALLRKQDKQLHATQGKPTEPTSAPGTTTSTREAPLTNPPQTDDGDNGDPGHNQKLNKPEASVPIVTQNGAEKTAQETQDPDRFFYTGLMTWVLLLIIVALTLAVAWLLFRQSRDHNESHPTEAFSEISGSRRVREAQKGTAAGFHGACNDEPGSHSDVAPTGISQHEDSRNFVAALEEEVKELQDSLQSTRNDLVETNKRLDELELRFSKMEDAEAKLKEAERVRMDYDSSLPRFLEKAMPDGKGTLRDFLDEQTRDRKDLGVRLEVALRGYYAADNEQEQTARLAEIGERLFEVMRAAGYGVDRQVTIGNAWAAAVNDSQNQVSVFFPDIGARFDGTEMTGPHGVIRTVEIIRGWGVRNARRTVVRKALVG